MNDEKKDLAEWEWYTTPPYEDSDDSCSLDESEDVVRIIQPDFSDTCVVTELLEMYQSKQHHLQSQVQHLRKRLKRVSLENTSLWEMIKLQNMEKLLEIEDSSSAYLGPDIPVMSASDGRLHGEFAGDFSGENIIPVQVRSLQNQPLETPFLDITPTDTENESDDEDEDVTGDEDDDDEPDDDDSQMSKGTITLELVPTSVSRASAEDRPSTTLVGRLFTRIRRITNLSSMTHAASVALVCITGYTIQELFRHEQKKPVEVVTKFSVKHMKISIKRFQKRAKPVMFFLSYMKAVVDWHHKDFTLVTFLVYMLSVYTGWFIQLFLLLCILKLYVNYITTHQYPVDFCFLPDMRNGGMSAELPFGKIRKRKKFGILLQVAKQAQIELGNIAGNMEKLNNLFMWKVPQLTMFCVKILVLLFILSIMLPSIQFMKLIGIIIGIKVFVLRRLYKMYPNFKYATDTIHKVWKALPTDAEFYERNTLRKRTTRQYLSEKIKKLRCTFSKSSNKARGLDGKKESSTNTVQVIVTQEDTLTKRDASTDMEMLSIARSDQEECDKTALEPNPLEPKAIEKKPSSGSLASFNSLFSCNKQGKTSKGKPEKDTPTTSGGSAEVVSNSSSGNITEVSKSPSGKASVASTSGKASAVSRSPSGKATEVSKSPSGKASTECNSSSEKASEGSNSSSGKASVISNSYAEKASVASNSPSGKAAVVSFKPSGKASVASTPNGGKPAELFDPKEITGTLQSTTSLSTSFRSVGSQEFSYTQLSSEGSEVLSGSTGSHLTVGNERDCFALPVASRSTRESSEGSTGRLSDRSTVSSPGPGVIGMMLGEPFNSLAGTFFTGPATLIKSNKHNEQITLPNGEQPLKEASLGWTCVLEENTSVFGTTFHPGTLYLSLTSLCFKPTDVTSSPLLNIDLCKIIKIAKAKKLQWRPGKNRSEHIHVTVEGVEKPYIFGSVSAYDECYKVVMMHGKVHNYQWAAEFSEVPQIYRNNMEYHFSVASFYRGD